MAIVRQIFKLIHIFMNLKNFFGVIHSVGIDLTSDGFLFAVVVLLLAIL